MSDPAPPPPAAPPRPKTSKIVLALLVLNLGASGFSTYTLATGGYGVAAAAPAPPAKPATLEVTGPVVAFDPFVVNLDEPGTSRYLKVVLQAELVDADAKVAFDKSQQPIRDAILSALSGLHVKDTLGASAKDAIRAELMTKIEKIIGPHQVRRLFFQEFVLQ